MSGSAKLTFCGITLGLFHHLRKRASRSGIQISGRAGEVEKDGIKIQWSYDVNARQLELQCTHAPFWMDTSRIHHDLRLEIEAILGLDQAA
jgi:hypothetical protein